MPTVEYIQHSDLMLSSDSHSNDVRAIPYTAESGPSTPILFAPQFAITRELQYGNRIFRLAQPISVKVNFIDGLWVHESPVLSLHAYANNRAESLDSFCMDFSTNWDVIAQEADANLTEDAKRVKTEYARIVESVQTLT
jgi:hypothetical protein